MPKTAPPRSVTSGAIVALGLVAFVLSLLTMKFSPVGNLVDCALFCLTMTAVVLGALDLAILKVHRRPSTGLDFSIQKPNTARLLTKLIGLLSSIGFLALCYWLATEYHGDFYTPYWQMLRRIFPVWLLLAVPYFWFLDSKQLNPQDGFYWMGRFTCLEWQNLAWNELGQHLLGWLVKGFFLPLMFIYFTNDLQRFSTFDFTSIHSFKNFFDFTYDFIFLIDVGFVTMGYLMSLKLLDSHLRSTEPTMLGWVSALICYQPFWALFGKQYLDYENGSGWGTWLDTSPVFYSIWGSVILLLFGVYVWSSVMFGLRFSNLTNRGILTNGPYRWTKHPAYVAKNLAWWMIAVPFATNSGFVPALRQCTLLLLLNGIYYLRARTEERHLLQDPAYQAYSLWIAQHGIFRRLPKLRR